MVDVAVIGAGVAGLATAIQLKRRGRESFVVLERGDDVGGTWRDNTYPGVACDVPAPLYAYSFRPQPAWTHRYARGAQVQEYLRTSTREEGLAPHVRLRTDVLDASWESDDDGGVDAGGRWHVTAATPDGVLRVRARVLVTAVGRFGAPHTPEVAGLDGFSGPVVHTGRWDARLDLRGLRVGVVGTGASAVQVVPALAGVAEQVVVFQRTAPWIVPRGDAEVAPGERSALERDPAAVAALRAGLLAELDAGIAARRRHRPALEALRARAREHLAAQVPDGPLRRALTPAYEVGCKRVLLSDDYYPTLLRSDVALEPSALARVEGSTAVAGSGARHELDALVLATGFTTSTPPIAARLHGRSGLALAQRWAGGMTAYASTAVPGFPNLFLLGGPHAVLGHSSAIDVLEAQVEHVLGALEHLRRHGPGARPLEVGEAAEAAYLREVDALAADTVWDDGGCTSWYRDERSGRLALLWPASAAEFRARNARFDPAAYGAAS
ncbi:Predicted flavoprotein CzcO associated with the cation diffusion facilitator CzcD [Quadrisphaera granulorum]|uniref:Cation diffusion facilitator CzcD-associated flavoprotein CzcO n=1 Tax=Quadrisphaera granulorum TaxID=317664 RepID=A0A316A5C3_9ACTN|nr:NAD(P)/FAD-dependent oxidoreductase [Quadrisphaera granulorum]PWJ52763.1 cation diffusion facilitator CzcD-associated flavoprotein CzcO [Quadrisphaera granulorum]SZE97368.1 Predicted flavoprotein CzcO associated with the cation diffusion facilitator CzcD [Quadrisphaera granulorum]